MCIIAAKPAGVDMISREIIQNMWAANRDGAGFMYLNKGQVRIEKGFMTYASLEAALDRLETSVDLKATPFVLHCRITTHGGTKATNCHPFPITDSVAALGKPVSNTTIGVAHNGIIPITPRKGISDTMEYIASQLAPLHRALPKFYQNKHAMQLIENAIQSKMAFLTKDGAIYTIGKFIEDQGVLYSNDSYKASYFYGNRRGGKFNCYADFDWDWDTWDKPVKALGTKDDSEADARLLQWLLDSDMVKLPSGDLEEGSDYLIDESGEVWYYEWDSDLAYKVPGAQATTAAGTAKHFDMDDPNVDFVYVDESLVITCDD